ncbi:hypothetical protein M9H77_08622 [Catharanthus roseus]|uniref:Uncharacterized protein n=1 Tax=Catharanthus roseus TaxID=4058 RepID=A0ACC0BYI3_CATRO|nr:hypothetical protein M9H77_08622 [Catharanthus roseus]
MVSVCKMQEQKDLPDYYNWSARREPSWGYRLIVREGSVTRNVERNITMRVFFMWLVRLLNPMQRYYNYEEAPNPETQRFYDMLKSVDIPLNERCTNYSRMSVMARLLNIKSENNMFEKCFD